MPIWGRTIRDIVLIAAIAAVPAMVSALVHPNRPALPGPEIPEGELTLDQVQALPAEDVLYLDARTREHYEEDHIPGALLLDEGEWDSLLLDVLTAWQPGMTVIVYCDSRLCDASHHVAKRLRDEMGWEDVYVLHGGWETWLDRR